MKYLSLFLAALFAMSTALAGPGAHGPNGEHLDGPATSAGAASTAPRIETFTESFELVGHLSGGELSVMIDRYETNEPVLRGQLEVQYKNLKAKAKYHADLGDYAIDDKKFLAAISKPGAHPLVFTLVAGDESDLLEGTLNVSAIADDHAPASRSWLLAAVAVLAALLVVAALIVRRRRQHKEI